MDYSYDMGEVSVTHAQFQIVGRHFAVSSRYVVRIGHALFLRRRSSFVVKIGDRLFFTTAAVLQHVTHHGSIIKLISGGGISKILRVN